MTLDILCPLYVVAARYAQTPDSETPDKWHPSSTQCYLVRGVAEEEAKRTASRFFEGDKFAVIEYSAGGAEIVGDIYPGARKGQSAIGDVAQ